MRKLVCFVLMITLLLTAVGAEAAKKPEYTLSTKNCTVLQNAPDRGVTPQTEAARRDPVAGESPVTGLPWEGEYLPIMAQICNTSYKVKVNGKSVKTAGVGNRAPWGLQYADVIYEVPLYRTGGTRFTALFSDCFADGQTVINVGPVRSTRMSQLLLCAEWQAGFVYGGGDFNTFDWMAPLVSQLYDENGGFKLGVLLDVQKPFTWDYRYRVQGKKAPSNLNVDIAGLRGLIAGDYVAQPRPFLFADKSPYADGYESAGTIHLDWGEPVMVSHFVYDESSNAYTRYCGQGVKETKWVPFTSFPSPEDANEDDKLPLSFANLIVQRVKYETDDQRFFMPFTQSIGRGNADIFIGGRYIPGYWVRASAAEPTVYYDDQGNELVLNRGKTYVAQMPPECLCAFTQEKK